jgi:hypothetical protein
MSISEIVAAVHSEALSRLGAGGGGVAAAAAGGKSTGTASTVAPPKGPTLTGVQVAKLAFDAGFRGQALIDWVGIAMRESHGNSVAHNPKPPDDSYGLWQINMLGSMGDSRLKTYGLKSREDLYDPATNARAAYQMSGGGKNHGPWTIKGDWTQNVDLKSAANYVAQANVGDPMPMDMRAGGSSVHMTTGASITFAPTINFYGTPQTPDLTRIAKEVGRQLQEQVRTLELRNA